MSKRKSNNDRTRSFESRLLAEREVLTIVNSNRDAPELLGLTEFAIKDWEIRCGTHSSFILKDEVAAILRVLARETGTISDQSREVFTQSVDRTPSQELLDLLEDRLKSQNLCE